MKSHLTIGSLARESGVGIQTIRFYERKGLLPEPKRRESGYREYSPEDATRLRFIKRAQDLGFTLREIQELMEMNSGRRATCADVKRKADKKLQEVEEKIRDLKAMRKTLRELSEACSESKTAMSECRVMNCFESEWKC